MASTAASDALQRQDIRVAIAKSVELRALHAALLQGGNSSSPALQRLQPGSSPSLSRASNQFSGEDYPVFAPSYEEEPLPAYNYILPENRSLSENWSEIELERETRENDVIESDTTSVNKFSNNRLSNRSSCVNHLPILPSAHGVSILKSSSRRTSSGEFKPVTTCNTCKPDVEQKNIKDDISTLPSTNMQPSIQYHSRNKGAIFSWLFPKSKKKPKPEMSPNTIESEDMSQVLKDWGVFSIETLKKDLLEANEKRDAALAEVSGMKSSLGELKLKLSSLESYCEELKKALKQAMQGKDNSKRTKPTSGIKENSMPVSHEVMVEGFLQIVSEARLSVKQLCKTLINHTEETDNTLTDKLNLLLQPYQMTVSSKHHSKGVLYHLEALINQSLYQDFENCVFQKNGAPKVLDPHQDRLENFSSFVALRNLSWNEVLRKGTKYYSEDFSEFCDQKMSGIVSVLNWSRPWPELLLQSFFVSAKCIWLLHLLAFSFSPPLMILRVDEGRNFDPLYMEDVLRDRRQAQAPAQVKIMVMPGFYVQDRVLRCRVICRYMSVA